MFAKSDKKETRLETVVGSGTELEGNLSTAEGIRVDGRVKGGLRAETLVIGTQGIVLGDLTANKITISGKVEGNVSGATLVELLPQAQVLGDIRTSKIIIADGARFEGNCQMIKSDGQVIELNPELVEGHQNQPGRLKVISQQKQKATA